MGEPTIPEAAVEAAAKAAHQSQEERIGGRLSWEARTEPEREVIRAIARAALAAAEPLMHEGCRADAGWAADTHQANVDVIVRMDRHIARLREAAKEFVSVADAFPEQPLGPNTKKLFADGFRRALEASEEKGRDDG